MARQIVPYGMDSATGQVEIGVGSVDTFNGLPVLGPVPATPTLSLGAAAGSGATSSIVGSNLAGQITLNSGTGILVAGTVMTMTLGGGFSFPNGSAVLFSAGNANFASVLQYLSAASTVSTAVLSVSLALTISRTYVGFYFVTGW